MSKSTKRVLLDAANLIETRGWHQGSYESKDGCLCIFGAVHQAANHGDYEEAWHLLWERTVTDSPIDWNDQPGRTKDEVLALLRETAEAAGE